MFTGLIEEVGTVIGADDLRGGRILRVSAHRVTEDLAVGDSVALNGVCQTVTAWGADWFSVEAVGDTLAKTTLGSLGLGASLNLERACRADSRLGGHFVLGHVNGMGRVVNWSSLGAGSTLEVVPPPLLCPYLVDEGSVTLDGVSLTVAQVWDDRFRVSVIPHTRETTTLRDWKVGQSINIEADILAKYVEGLLRPRGRGLEEEALKRWGYA